MDQGLLYGLANTWPARLGQGILSGLMLPGDVYSGKTAITGDDGHTSPDVITRSADLANFMTAAPAAFPGGVASGELRSGASNVVNMGSWKNAREASQLTDQLTAIRKNNLQDTFSSGGGIVHEFPNKWSIGEIPQQPFVSGWPQHSHVLVSPQGSAALYGHSPIDLIKRGFPDEEIPALMSHFHGY